MILKRTDGPACTRCGCKDSEILFQPQRTEAAQRTEKPNGEPWVTSGQAACNHCGERFSFTEESPGIIAMLKRHKALVPVAKWVCPNCRSERIEIRSSPKAKGRSKVRYCRCGNCGTTFKDSECDPLP